MLYFLIGLCLTLAGVASLQLMYMFYLDRLDRERKKRVHELEVECKRLSARLDEAKDELRIKNEMLSGFLPDHEEEEAWADVLEDR